MPKKNKAVVHRQEWPRIREITVKGKILFQVDPRPHGKREHFSALTRAETRADQIAKDRMQYGVEGVYMSIKDRIELAEARDRLRPYQKTISQAVDHYITHLNREMALQGAITMQEAVEQWEKSYQSKRRSHQTMIEIRSKARIFAAAMGHLRLPEIGAATVKDFLDGYRIDGDKIPSEQTLKNLRTKLSQFFEYARLKSWVLANPCELVKQEGAEREIEILSVDEAENLLKIAKASKHAAEVVPYLAVSLFAGLRPGEAEQLDWKNIHLDIKEIDVLANTSKTRRLRHVRLENTAIAWLEGYKKRAGVIVGEGWRDKWAEVRRTAGYRLGEAPESGWPKTAKEWPDDVLRHTFASYWLPIHHSKAELARRMGNSEEVIDRHYSKTIREAEAKKFWELKP